MKDQRKTEIRVGITVIIGLLLFLWILGWAKNFSLVSNEKETTVKFRNVAGLEIGDNVTISGVRKGYVKDMQIKDNDVYVTLSLDEDVKLNKDASFSVAMLDLMGGKRIEIDPGTSNEAFNYSEIHNGKFMSDIPFVMSMVGNMQKDIAGSLKDIEITLKSLNSYLTDENLHKDVKNSVSNLSEVTEKLKLILNENREDIRKLIENSNALTGDAKKMINENKDNIASSLGSLKDVLQKTDTLLTKINSFAAETNEKKNNLGKLIYDKDFYDDLNKSLNQLNSLTKILIKQLQDEGVKVDAHISIF
jgi:phospholipid/cholesterol/gamma-HCH transport system substrate-binding protein